MALATGLAFGAAAASGVALGASCSAQLGRVMKAFAAAEARPATEGTSAPAPATAAAPPPRSFAPPSDLNDKILMAEDRYQPKETPISWEGFSMEEARAHADAEQLKAMSRRPVEVLAELQRGNARFWMNSAKRPEASAFNRRALISKQFPSVAILGCSDSRVPIEIVFDQGLGDVFVIRVAGNALSTATQASLQYAVHHLKVKVVVVLGHELCGAVKAAQLPVEALEKEAQELEQALKSIKAGLNQSRFNNLRDSRALDREAVTTNVKQQVERLTRDSGIMGKVKTQELLVIGAFYEVGSGIVDFFHEVSGDAAESTPALRKMPSRGVSSVFVPSASK